MYRKLLVLLFALVLVFSLHPADVSATESEPTEVVLTGYDINPMYAELLSEEDMERFSAVDEAPIDFAGDADYVSLETAKAQMRAAMVARQGSFSINFYSAESDGKEGALELLYGSMEHTGVPNEGDYIYRHYSGCGYSYYPPEYHNGAYYHRVSFTLIDYHTTAEQEAVVDIAVSQLLNTLDINDKSDYEKVLAIYQYICDTVTYDYDNDYDLKYSAYAALINKTSVCQGYASLFYRLTLEVGVDSRYIRGTGNGGAHGWNIVRIGDYYYNLDATWDAGEYGIGDYDYFLRCDDDFYDHYRNTDYATSEYYAQYPMSPVNYPYHYHPLVGTAATVATPFSDGNTAYWSCDTCYTYYSDPAGIYEIPYGSWVIPSPDLKAPEKPYKIANVVNGVHVFWNAVEGVQKYGVFRSETGKDGTYKWLGSPTVAHFTDVNVVSGKTYYYKITFVDTRDNTHSEKSEALGITYVATPVITVRANVAAGIRLRWDEVAGATGYAIYRKSYDGTDPWVRVGTVTGKQTVTWTDTSVKNNNGTVYKYTIRALAGSKMNILSGCRGTGMTMVRLTSQTLNSADATSDTSVKCTWSTSRVVNGYEVRFMVDGQVYKTFAVGNYKTGAKTFAGLLDGKTYKIQVRTFKKVAGVGIFYSAWSVAQQETT